MSRAFVRESDDRPELPIARPAPTLPPGAKNYLTPDGAERMRAELQQLIEVAHPKLVAADNADAKRQLLVIDQRIAQLEQSLQSAEIVEPSGDTDTVRFGATVTVRRATGDEDSYRIVGVDEIDLDRGCVSWMSPIARALINQHAAHRCGSSFLPARKLSRSSRSATNSNADPPLIARRRSRALRFARCSGRLP